MAMTVATGSSLAAALKAAVARPEARARRVDLVASAGLSLCPRGLRTSVSLAVLTARAVLEVKEETGVTAATVETAAPAVSALVSQVISASAAQPFQLAAACL